MTKDFFSLLLPLDSSWDISNIDFRESTGEVHIYLCWNSLDYKSLHPGIYGGIHDYSVMRTWRHLDIFQYKTFIHAKIPRLKDKDGNVYKISIPWADGGVSYSLLFEEKVVNTLLATQNQTKTASLLGCSFDIVNRIMHQSVCRGLAKRSKNTIYAQLSIDEKAFQKAHFYVSVLSDPVSGKVLEVVPNRTKEACEILLNQSLTETQKSHVSTVSLDMWPAYNTAVSQILPKARKVHDRFHLIKYLNEVVDKVRKREVKNTEKLKNSRYALLKNTCNLSIKQEAKLEDALRENLTIAQVWGLKETFKWLFRCPDYHTAHSKYMQWVSYINWVNIPELTKVATMFSKHIVGVCNALIENTSNAMAERLNGKIQLIKTIGRGYRTFTNFRSAILFFNGGLDLNNNFKPQY